LFERVPNTIRYDPKPPNRKFYVKKIAENQKKFKKISEIRGYPQ
jgi:hypothetical protein